jgi:succinyl-CoA synthetase beta subunit
VLVNIVGSVPTALEIASVITNFVQRHEDHPPTTKTRSHPYPRLIVRLADLELEAAREQLKTVQVPLVENLDEAVEQTVRLAKGNAAKR